LVEAWPEYWKDEETKWDEFDKQGFDNPDTVGECIFVSCLEGEPVGLASYDPRHEPAYGIIGQNCILPECRGWGFGGRQILEILRRFEEREIEVARVTTSEHPFFLPARKMYGALGFREIRRFAGGPDPRFGLIELALPLAPLR